MLGLSISSMIPQVDNFFKFCSLRAGVVTAAVLCILTFVVESFIGLAVLKNPETAGFETQSRMIGVLFLLLGLWNMAMAYFLYKGLSTGQSHHLKPWLAYTMLNLVLGLIEILLSILRGHFRIFLRLVELGFYAYLWVVVYSYYMVMESAQSHQEEDRRNRSTTSHHSS